MRCDDGISKRRSIETRLTWSHFFRWWKWSKRYVSMKVAPLTMAAWLAISNASAGIGAFTPHRVFSHGSFVRRRGVRCQSTPQLDTPQLDSEPDIPQQEADTEKGAFVNDGPLAGLSPYLDKLGLKEGKSVFMGALAIDVDESKRNSEEEASALRQKSAQDLTNIGMDERERRDKAGNVMWAVSAVYVAWASLIADDGGLSGHFLRFLSVIPLFLADGYKVSAKTGLWNIAQAGLWDVDGNGLSKIEDPTIASAILEKVNKMNISNLVKCAQYAGAFAILPQSASVPLVSFGALFAVLYAVQGKIPEPKA
jgi:hypothetical protein